MQTSESVRTLLEQLVWQRQIVILLMESMSFRVYELKTCSSLKLNPFSSTPLILSTIDDFVLAMICQEQRNEWPSFSKDDCEVFSPFASALERNKESAKRNEIRMRKKDVAK